MNPNAVHTAVLSMSDFLLSYFVALAAVGALAMALIELAKKLHHIRTRYHAQQVFRWLQDEFGRTPSPLALPCLAELLQLCCGINREHAEHAALDLVATHGQLPGMLRTPDLREHAVFALELEKMMGHIQDAADTALGDPASYPALFEFITSGVRAEDAQAWRAFLDNSVGATSERNARRDADLYTRLQQSVRRKLDAFQLYCGMRWANLNQLWANIVGASVLFVVLLSLAVGGSRFSAWSLWQIVLASLAGGLLAPLAKDVVVALQRVRAGR